jgi:ribosomal-protein-alanine N-acetyltransferase
MSERPEGNREATRVAARVSAATIASWVRPARRGDLGGIMVIERSSFAHANEAFNARQVAGLIANPRAVTLVAARRGQVLGWAVGLLRSHGKRRSGRLYAIAVSPSAQGQGIGTALLRKGLASMRRRGAERIYLEVRQANAAAIALYERHGFTHHDRLPHYYARGVHGVRMVLNALKTTDAAGQSSDRRRP